MNHKFTFPLTQGATIATTNNPSMGLAIAPKMEIAACKMLPSSPTRKATPMPLNPAIAAKQKERKNILVNIFI